MATAPFLSRLYSPAEYGIFGLLSAVIAVAISFTSFRLAHVIQIAEKQEDAETMYVFCRYIVAAVSLVILLVSGAAYFSLQEWFASNGLGLSFLLIVPAIFLSGLMEVNSIWLNRNKSFRSISANKVIAAIVTASVSLTWAFLVNRTFLGLFAGLLIGQVAAVLFAYESRKFRSGPMVIERALKLIKYFKDFLF